MLAVGRQRADGRALRRTAVDFVEANAEDLPFGDGEYDAVTIAFGIRNVPRIDRALAEAFRVLKPGGRFLCLEFSTVDVAGLDRLYELFSFKVIPAIGDLVVGDGEPYRYLVESIRRFPNQARFAAMIEDAGFAASACAISPAASPPCIPAGSSEAGMAGTLAASLRLAGAGFVLAREGAFALVDPEDLPAGPRAAVASGPAVRAARRHRRRSRRAPDRSRSIGLGPSYVKLGQFLATRPDLVGREGADALGRLRDEIAPFPEAEARARHRKVARQPVEALFASFSPPIAAASIAQVHKAEIGGGRGRHPHRRRQGAAPRHSPAFSPTTSTPSMSPRG